MHIYTDPTGSQCCAATHFNTATCPHPRRPWHKPTSHTTCSLPKRSCMSRSAHCRSVVAATAAAPPRPAPAGEARRGLSPVHVVGRRTVFSFQECRFLFVFGVPIPFPRQTSLTERRQAGYTHSTAPVLRVGKYTPRVRATRPRHSADQRGGSKRERQGRRREGGQGRRRDGEKLGSQVVPGPSSS